MAVQVVRRQIDEDSALWAKVGGVLELKAGGLTGHRRIGLDGADQGGERCADVACDGDRQSRCPIEMADQLGRRGLAVGACHGAEGIGNQPPGELELAGHLQAALARRSDDRRVLRHTGALHHRSGTIELPCSFHAQTDFDAGPLQPCRLLGQARVDAEHGLPALGEHAGDRRARARQAHHQEGPGGQRRTRFVARNHIITWHLIREAVGNPLNEPSTALLRGTLPLLTLPAKTLNGLESRVNGGIRGRLPLGVRQGLPRRAVARQKSERPPEGPLAP